MPRRRALTEAQLDALFALPITEADLIRHWTLDGADLAVANRRRGASNQLGYALQLCAFRYPGRLLRPGEAIPEPTLRFVAEQVHIGADALAAYAARPQTRREQLDALREAFGFRMFGPGDGRELLAWLLPVALATTSAPNIASTLMDELRRRRIVAPGPSTLERLVAAGLVAAERHVAGQLTRDLPEDKAAALDALLGPKEGTAISVLAWRGSPRAPPGTRRSAAWSISLPVCAPSASTLPAPRAYIRGGCASSPARARATPRSICGLCLRSAGAPPWSPPCWTPRRV